MASRSKKKRMRKKENETSWERLLHSDVGQKIISDHPEGKELKVNSEMKWAMNKIVKMVKDFDSLKVKSSDAMQRIEEWTSETEKWNCYNPSLEMLFYKSIKNPLYQLIIHEIEDSIIRFMVIFKDELSYMGQLEKESLEFLELGVVNPFTGIMDLLEYKDQSVVVFGRDMSETYRILITEIEMVILEYVMVASYFSNGDNREISVVYKGDNDTKREYTRRTKTWFRKGHWKTLRSGKKVWFRPTVCGDRMGDREQKNYVIE